jgi:coproporphyrinogen III oxidase
MKNKFLHTKFQDQIVWIRRLMVKPNSKKTWDAQKVADAHVIENGKVFEKGVNISAVHGNYQPCKNVYVGEADFFACGLSLVLHPKNYGAYSSCQLALF